MTRLISMIRLMRSTRTEWARGESTGYDNVDELYTMVAGQLTVVTGHPSSGKSEFIDQIMVNMAQEKDWKFAICSLKMSRVFTLPS